MPEIKFSKIELLIRGKNRNYWLRQNDYILKVMTILKSWLWWNFYIIIHLLLLSFHKVSSPRNSMKHLNECETEQMNIPKFFSMENEKTVWEWQRRERKVKNKSTKVRELSSSLKSELNCNFRFLAEGYFCKSRI